MYAAGTCEELAAIKLQGLVPIKFYMLQTLHLPSFAKAMGFCFSIFITWWLLRKKVLKHFQVLKLATVKNESMDKVLNTNHTKGKMYYL